MESKGHGVFARIHQLYQFIVAAYAADEVDSLVGARILDAQQRRQKGVLQN